MTDTTSNHIPDSSRAPIDAQTLLDIARETGLRSFLHGVNATDAREILARYQLAVDVHRGSLPADPERQVSGWVYDATRQALDAAHAVCLQFGCPRGEQVDEWLRAQLLAMGGLLRAAGEAADVITRFKPKGNGTEIRLRSAIGAAQIAGATPAEPFLLQFPTMLRKMWSGGEVQAWLDALPVLYAAPHAAPLARRGWLLTFSDESLQFATDPQFVGTLVARGIKFESEELFARASPVEQPAAATTGKRAEAPVMWQLRRRSDGESGEWEEFYGKPVNFSEKDYEVRALYAAPLPPAQAEAEKCPAPVTGSRAAASAAPEARRAAVRIVLPPDAGRNQTSSKFGGENNRVDALTDEQAAAMYVTAAASITGCPTFEQWSAALVRALLAASPVEQPAAVPADGVGEIADAMIDAMRAGGAA
ncbi:hypothetical protein WT67_29525 [Burkholderia stagnalis]|uniref:Uncharacterized protein n=1 Tax=Burkholderia stagnalis TaxID=1503054 RepID=A0A6L3N7F8_9BURK|nr:hypothetical protein [Burkholderia stagnalis]KAB0641560.1 hypothetical protein F7R25_00510 [Burkholderia stagnalis]KVO47861.1 hypothetical protein WT17_05560 [Burkholderia stagnalis]KVO70024.1 hypothetical protein WT19_00880 [Burkholderia stagnalis]KVW59325.1 hypothetical protein WT28_23155 [Burkholderia stagnalis]KVW72415.1 hypothetical protein WT29_30235 [Burkholderia stagnalis]